MLISLLFQDPLTFVILITVLMYSLTLHELAHGYAAYLFGDDTAKRAGRLTFNPLKHLDPFGALLLLFAGVGWAKPVPINVSRLRPYRPGLFAVSIAGIAVNITLSVLFGLLLYWLNATRPEIVFYAQAKNHAFGLAGMMTLVAYYAGLINLVLALFNLVPVPPLDGSRILMALLPTRLHPHIWRLDRYALYTFLVIVADNRMNGPLSQALYWAQNAYRHLVLG